MGKGWPKEIHGLNNFISVKEIIISCQKQNNSCP